MLQNHISYYTAPGAHSNLLLEQCADWSWGIFDSENSFTKKRGEPDGEVKSFDEERGFEIKHFKKMEKWKTIWRG